MLCTAYLCNHILLERRGGKRKCQDTVSRVGRWTTRAFKQSHFVLYFILRSGSFVAACLQVIANGDFDPRLPWADRCVVQASTTRRPSSHIEDGEGAVGPRSTTDSTE